MNSVVRLDEVAVKYCWRWTTTVTRSAWLRSSRDEVRIEEVGIDCICDWRTKSWEINKWMSPLQLICTCPTFFQPCSMTQGFVANNDQVWSMSRMKVVRDRWRMIKMEEDRLVAKRRISERAAGTKQVRSRWTKMGTDEVGTTTRTS